MKVLGRVPLAPCFVEGNTRPTLPHRFGRLGRVRGSGRGLEARRRKPQSPVQAPSVDVVLPCYGHERKASIVQDMEALA
jgi:hypothetical protein